MPSLALIIPTKDRPGDIRTLLENLSSQSRCPDTVIVVDASAKPQPELSFEFPELNIDYHLFKGQPSAAGQRNAGLAYVGEEVEIIGFVDDDIVFEKDAMQVMMGFWDSDNKDVCGAAFNLSESEVSPKGIFKHSRIAEWLGLYRTQPGTVAKSGWHSRLGEVKDRIEVEWLISGASFWRREVLEKHQFDPFFQGYSYLEDLDFSYGVSRNCRLMVVADARFEHHHHHQSLDTQWYRDFGRMEVRNRLYFVRKYGLSVWRCYLGLSIRFFQTLLQVLKPGNKILLSRARGNLAGFMDSIKGGT